MERGASPSASRWTWGGAWATERTQAANTNPNSETNGREFLLTATVMSATLFMVSCFNSRCFTNSGSQSAIHSDFVALDHPAGNADTRPPVDADFGACDTFLDGRVNCALARAVSGGEGNHCAIGKSIATAIAHGIGFESNHFPARYRPHVQAAGLRRNLLYHTRLFHIAESCGDLHPPFMGRRARAHPGHTVMGGNALRKAGPAGRRDAKIHYRRRQNQIEIAIEYESRGVNRVGRGNRNARGMKKETQMPRSRHDDLKGGRNTV